MRQETAKTEKAEKEAKEAQARANKTEDELHNNPYKQHLRLVSINQFDNRKKITP